MKSINKVILGIWMSTLSFSVFALDPDPIAALAPPGSVLGDEFYVMFTSTTTTAGNLTVDHYNDLVNTDADAANIGPTNGLTWSALMNHKDSGNVITEQTLSLFAANTAAPVYTTTGATISVSSSALFGGSIDTAISFDANGASQLGLVYTGSDSAGSASFPLGNSTDSPYATMGSASEFGIKWIDDGSPASDPKTFANVHIYAVSQLLRVTATSVVPIIAPTASNDVATVTVNESVDIDVLANDGAGSDPIDANTVAVVLQPVNGDITNINTSNGVVTYLPNANYVGSDSFTYLVKDNNNMSSNIATVSITVTAAAASGGGAMGWSLFMFFSVLSLLRVKVRK